MRVGIDFDGVIAQLPDEFFHDHLRKIRVCLEDLEHGRYGAFTRVFDNFIRIHKPPIIIIPSAIQAIARLQAQGAKVFIVTARSEISFAPVMEILPAYSEINWRQVTIVTTAGEPKSRPIFRSEINWHVDDSAQVHDEVLQSVPSVQGIFFPSARMHFEPYTPHERLSVPHEINNGIVPQ